MAFLVIPVKTLTEGKIRLSGLLRPKERHLLCLYMLKDVLRAAKRAKPLEGIIVVSSDRTALDLAVSMGAFPLREGVQRGLNEAVRLANRTCARRGAQSALILPIDIPLVKEEDIDLVVSAASHKKCVVITPSRNERGTNALLTKPPGIIRPRFGVESFEAHIDEAKVAGIPFEVCRLGRIALDIDTPDDLMVFLSEGKGTETHDYIIRAGIAERIHQALRALHD